MQSSAYDNDKNINTTINTISTIEYIMLLLLLTSFSMLGGKKKEHIFYEHRFLKGINKIVYRELFIIVEKERPLLLLLQVESLKESRDKEE